MKLHWKLNPYSSLQYSNAQLDDIIKLMCGVYDIAANNTMNML